MEYIGLAICKLDTDNTNHLYEFPAFRELKQGDRVIVETSEENGCYATVEAVYNARMRDEFHELDFILCASGEEKPLKRIVARVEYNYFKYEED